MKAQYDEEDDEAFYAYLQSISGEPEPFSEEKKNPQQTKTWHQLEEERREAEMERRKAEQLKIKEWQITNVLETLRINGISAKLLNRENACIGVWTRHNRRLTYYATTGTIAGYGNTNVEGLDELLRMCLD